MNGHAESDPQHLLVIYLQDHLAGSAGGFAVIRRLCKANVGTDLGATAAEIAVEIEDERALLSAAVEQHAATPDRLRAGAMRVAAALGAWKPNGRIVRRSPLSDVLELEMLIGGIEAKERLWTSLAEVYGSDAGPSSTRTYGALAAQAASQRERLIPHHLDAARQAFADAPPLYHPAVGAGPDVTV